MEEVVSPAPPPNFGYSMLSQFAFEENYINLNNGSYGSPPREVLKEYSRIMEIVESNPDKFHRLECQSMLVGVRERLAEFIGVADVDEIVMVPNTSYGLNTVLRELDWKPGDIVIGATTTYNSIHSTMQYLSDTRGVEMSTLELKFPTTKSAILSNWKSHIQSVKSNLSSSRSIKVVAVIDSIASNPGVLLPWKEMVALCRANNIMTVIDAAHSIGQEPNIDLDLVRPDFWVSNCHKWLYGKRGTAVLYIPRKNQHLIRATFPTSYAYRPAAEPGDRQLRAQFDWNSTIDFIPWLCMNASLNFRFWIGGEEKINAYCHDLAIRGGGRLLEILGTELLDEIGEFTLNMVNVALPLPRGKGFSAEIDQELKTKLLREWNVYAAHYYHNDLWWVRCSAQIWNEIGDFEFLGLALTTICGEIRASLSNERSTQAKL